MNIGRFDKTRDGFSGAIRTLSVFEFVKIVRCEKKSQNSPDFRVLLAQTEIGAAWEQKTSEGRPYLSVVIDDPGFPEPINAGLFEAEHQSFNLIWTRRKDA